MKTAWKIRRAAEQAPPTNVDAQSTVEQPPTQDACRKQPSRTCSTPCATACPPSPGFRSISVARGAPSSAPPAAPVVHPGPVMVETSWFWVTTDGDVQSRKVGSTATALPPAAAPHGMTSGTTTAATAMHRQLAGEAAPSPPVQVKLHHVNFWRDQAVAGP